MSGERENDFMKRCVEIAKDAGLCRSLNDVVESLYRGVVSDSGKTAFKISRRFKVVAVRYVRDRPVEGVEGWEFIFMSDAGVLLSFIAYSNRKGAAYAVYLPGSEASELAYSYLKN
jgi:hypothetical protein